MNKEKIFEAIRNTFTPGLLTWIVMIVVTAKTSDGTETFADSMLWIIAMSIQYAGFLAELSRNTSDKRLEK